MPTNTENNNFRRPVSGDKDYDYSFNTFFGQLDKAVEIRDIDANRSGYTPKDGAKFFATDTEDVYLGNGSNWVHVSGSGDSPSFDSVAVSGAVSASDITADAITINDMLSTSSTATGDDVAVKLEGTDALDNVIPSPQVEFVSEDDSTTTTVHHSGTIEQDGTSLRLDAKDGGAVLDIDGGNNELSLTNADLDVNGNDITNAGSTSVDSATIANELGLPEYDDVSNAPQTQGRLVYATGNGASAEGIYAHDGSSYSQVGGVTSEWQEDGNGNLVPIDDETVGDGTTTADHQSLSTGQATVGDTSTDPSVNGEVRRNGSDVKVHSGGAVQNISDIGSGGLTTKTIDDTNSPYTTQGEDVIYCDTSNGHVEIKLSSADATLGNEIRIIVADGTNSVSVLTEGSETIDPNGDDGKLIITSGWTVSFVSDGVNWNSSFAGRFEILATSRTDIYDTNSDPTSDGELRRNGDDVKVYSGGEVQNLSNVGNANDLKQSIETPTASFSGPAHGEGSDAFVGAALAPDERVIFAPFGSSNIGIFDPSTDSYTSGPVHSEGKDAFKRGALTPNGRVVFAPNYSDAVGIFDPSNDSYTSGPAHGEGDDAFSDAVRIPDGRVVFAPEDSYNIGIFDPSNDSYASGPTHGEDRNAFSGGALAPDGRTVFAPYDSDSVGIFDPSNDSYTSGPAHGEGNSAFKGATLAPDGRVVLVPYNSDNIGIFDPSTDSYTSGPAHGKGGDAFTGGTLAPDGRVILVPHGSNTVGIFDPSTESYTSGPSHGEGGYAFRGAALASDGRVILVPYDSDNVGTVAQNLGVAAASWANR
jgi:streptogramin lyase